MPKKVLIASGGLFGRMLTFLFPKEVVISIAQLRFVFGSQHLTVLKKLPFKDRPKGIVPPSSPQELKLFEPLVMDVFEHVGKGIAESLIIDRLLKYRWVKQENGQRKKRFKYIESEGDVFLTELVTSKKPALALSAHIGSFELLAAFHAALGMPVSVIGRAPNYSALVGILHYLRRDYGVETIWRSTQSAVARLIRSLRGGRVLAVLLDQDTRLPSIYAPFFGLDAASPVNPIKLAIRYRLTIFTTFIVRLAPLKHRIISEKLDYNPIDPDVEYKILSEYNRRLEKLIMLYPEQWVWWHRRWRRRPEIDYVHHPRRLRPTNKYLDWLRSVTPSNH